MENIKFNLKEYLDDKFESVEKQFGEVIKRQNHTNGDVTNLKLWRMLITGGFIVLTGIGSYTLYLFKDNLKNEVSRQIMTEIETKYSVQIQK